MLAIQKHMENYNDSTPSEKGWTRGEMFAYTAEECINPLGILGYQCSYTGNTSNGTLTITELCEIVPIETMSEEGYYDVVSYSLYTHVADGVSTVLNERTWDPGYYKRTSLYDAMREAEEFIVEDYRIHIWDTPDEVLARPSYQAQSELLSP
jgi:hypothetical protein